MDFLYFSFPHLELRQKEWEPQVLHLNDMSTNYNERMNKVRMQFISKKSQEELIQQNFLALFILSARKAL